MAVQRRQRIIHVTSVGSSAADEILRLGRTPREAMALIRDAVGPAYEVTSADRILMTPVNEAKGGRHDDAARAADVQRALADDRVSALVCVRGGAWFVRILPMIDFDVLRRRRTPIFVFGFSEMTPLIGIAGAYARCVGLYDLGPGFLYGGMRRWAEKNVKQLTRGLTVAPEQVPGFASGWAAAKYRDAYADFFREVVDIIEGRGSPRRPTGHVRTGRLPARSTIRIVGGNLSLIEALLGSKHRAAFETRGRWLAIEDLDETPDRFDRMMAALKLAGLFERAEGILLGDFHSNATEQREMAYEALRHHLPKGRVVPIVDLDNFGHIWPIAPLPMHRPVELVIRRSGRGPARAHIEIPWHSWAS